jgi:hypothetical protein
MKTRNLQRTTPNVQLGSGEIDPATLVWFFVEPGNASGDIKKNGAAELFSKLQLYGDCASLEGAFA